MLLRPLLQEQGFQGNCRILPNYKPDAWQTEAEQDEADFPPVHLVTEGLPRASLPFGARMAIELFNLGFLPGSVQGQIPARGGLSSLN